MKEFVVYTALRMLLFVATYAVLTGIWVLVFGGSPVQVVPFIAAVIVSSLLALKLLAPHRDRFAAVVEARAQRASHKFEEIKSREDSAD